MIIDDNYKQMGISSKCSKYSKTDELIVFDKKEQAIIFADFVQANSIFEVTDGFLVSVNGTFATLYGWYAVLPEVKKRYNLQFRVI